MATLTRNTPLVLIIRDGWGLNPNPSHAAFDATRVAHERGLTPTADRLDREWPRTLIKTSGEDVGIPEGTMGNSEVGHQNIGAGRIVDQESVAITKACRAGLESNIAISNAIFSAKSGGKKIHLLGIASDAGVHGLMDHLYAIVRACKKFDVPRDRVVLHLFTDGRDTGPFTAGGDSGFIARIEQEIAAIGVGVIGSVCGRYYAMDRDHRWERVALAYACLTGRDRGTEARSHVGEEKMGVGAGMRLASSARAAVQAYYDAPTNESQQGDEFIVPTMIGTPEQACATRIADGDTVIFYNYRGDRPREISAAFVFPDDKWATFQNSPFQAKQNAEQWLLGALILQPNLIDQIGRVLPDASRFQSEAHAAIFSALTTLNILRQPGDLVGMVDLLRHDNPLDAVGGMGYLERLAAGTPKQLDVIRWAELIATPVFDRGPKLDLEYVIMTEYWGELLPYVKVAFPKPPKMTNIDGEYLSLLGVRQFRCAETEKYPHVTFFFNDYRDPPFPGESRENPPSPKVATYDLKPEMSALEVRDAVLRRLAAPDCEEFIVVNFANGDMVGHTGVLESAVAACAVVDACVGTIVDATLKRGGSLIVTADHGNCEQMFDPQTGSPHTAHTVYDVPLYVVGEAFRSVNLRGDFNAAGWFDPNVRARRGRLADIAPTALGMMGLAVPGEMTGTSLIVR